MYLKIKMPQKSKTFEAFLVKEVNYSLMNF
jgi:hypothetical protein